MMTTKKNREALELIKNHAAMRREWEALADKTIDKIQQINAMTEGGAPAPEWWSDMMDIHDRLEVLRYIGPLQLMRDALQERVKFEGVKVYRAGSFRGMAELVIRERPTIDISKMAIRKSIKKGLDDYYGMGAIEVMKVILGDRRDGKEGDILVRIRAADLKTTIKDTRPVEDLDSTPDAELEYGSCHQAAMGCEGCTTDKCYRCGLHTCKNAECSIIVDYLHYGKQRLCADPCRLEYLGDKLKGVEERAKEDAQEKKREPLTAAQQKAYDFMHSAAHGVLIRTGWYSARECKCSLATMRALERKGHIEAHPHNEKSGGVAWLSARTNMQWRRIGNE